MPSASIVTRGLLTAMVVAAAACASVTGVAFAAPVSVDASVPPHVAVSYDTDVCAMCHRTHTSANDATWTSAVATDVSHSALLVGSSGRGDVDLCFTCHGVDALGAGTDIQSSFLATSSHSLTPSESAYSGQGPKKCGTCHDSHGAARVPQGTPYPGLLRVTSSTGTVVFSGDRVCTSCHPARPSNLFPGQSVWQQTAHARVATPTSGTGIVCAVCHEQHGSPVAPSLRTMLATPAVTVPATVTANDRSFCLSCHDSAYGVWVSASVYARSRHATSATTVTAQGEWNRAQVSRRVGECQNCHAPMGAVDASGSIIPNLLSASGRAACDNCHRVGGPAPSKIASLAYSSSTPGNEVIAAFAPVSSPAYGRLQLFAREATAAAVPVGPREVSPVTSVGGLAAGDVDGDGAAEAVLSDLSAARIAVVKRDQLRAARSTLYNLPGGAAQTLVGVADVFLDGAGVREIVATGGTKTIEVTRLSGGALVSVASATIATTPTAIAVGDVTGSSEDDVVVLTNANTFYVLTQNGAASLSVGGPYATLNGSVALCVAELDGSTPEKEIAVVNTGAANNIVSFFRGSGASYASAGGGPVAVGDPNGIIAGDILPGENPAGTSGAEIAVTYASPNSQSGVRVMVQAPGGGLGAGFTAANYGRGNRTNASALAFGDADGDGADDLLVGYAGSFSKSSDATSPIIAALEPDGTGDALVSNFTLVSGGSELAAGKSRIALADMGAVGPSRHPVSVVRGSHTATETSPTARHVECFDCHNAHELSADASDTAFLTGEMNGAWGVRPSNLTSVSVALTGRQRATAEYEVCFSCHSTWDAAAPRSIASEVNTLGASFHPVEGASRPNNATGSTLTTATSVGATVMCTSCHGNSKVGDPAGPHRSPTPPLLQRRLPGASVTDPGILCYGCHKSTIYLTGTADSVGGDHSGFYANNKGGRKMHPYHTERGVTCAACHTSHGSYRQRFLIRGDTTSTVTSPFAYVSAASGGSCVAGCHNDPVTPYVYSR